MSTYIRLTDYRDGDSKEQGFFEAKNRYVAKQEDFAKIPGSPIAYWVSEKIAKAFENELLSNYGNTKKGVLTGNDAKYVRLWHEVGSNKIGYGLADYNDMITKNYKWIPATSGGSFRKWYGNFEAVINMENDSHEIKFCNANNFRLRDSALYFRECITWSEVSSRLLSIRYVPNGILFGNSGPVCFIDNLLPNICSFLNSKVALEFLKFLSPTMTFGPEQIEKLPLVLNNSTKQTIDTLTQECIDISREEWDSRETSWDFRTNGLLRFAHSDGKIESAYDAYCDYWREKFYILHANEEELNRLFIDIYELGDELTADVALDDITILKSESKIEDGKLVFKPDEIARQFVSYAVGCMFGRYCIGRDGLVVANTGQDYPRDTPFSIDDDNILPVLEEEVFGDDIVARFGEFVRVAFGDRHYEANIAWIEAALGMSVRKYFVAEFYKDHVRRYKKRPIYWLVQSPKKSFSALIYMHRYQSDTMARVQTMYLREYITKTEAQIHSLKNIIDSPTTGTKEKKESEKLLSKLEAKLADAISFDRGEMSRIAGERIEIDLDDGVKTNYQKFKGVLPDIGLAKDE